MIPQRASASAVRSPTPQSEVTGSECRNATVASAGTRSTPSGLAIPEASLATNFVAAIPTEHVTPCSARTRSRMRAATTDGGPTRRRAPETSRKASSMLTCSTRSVASPKISITARDAARYAAWSGGTTAARGQSRLACVMGIAAWIPKALAS